MEQLLKEIITKLDGLDKHMGAMEDRMGTMEGRMDSMEKKIDVIENQVVDNSEKLASLSKSMEFVKSIIFRHEEELYFIKRKIG